MRFAITCCLLLHSFIPLYSSGVRQAPRNHTRTLNSNDVNNTRRELNNIITHLVLVNADTQQNLLTLTEGRVVDISNRGTSFTIRAFANGGRSILFNLDGIMMDDSDQPYTLTGSTSVSEPTLALDRSHTLTASAHQYRRGFGTVLEERTVSFTITGSTANPCTLDAPDSVPNPVGTDVPAFTASPTGSLNGALRVWHKITLGFTGPQTCERANRNPFTEYRLDVTFVHQASGTAYTVPGYYAADGNAANTGATFGNVWLVHFAPDRDGSWTWSAEFTQGTNVAQDGGGTSAGFFDGESGEFTVLPSNKVGRDHRGKGRLEYVGEHHLRFAGTGEWFLKVGADSPENFLAYDDFDGTLNFRGLRKSWQDHLQDYNSNDPTWAGGKGKAILGAINYLSEKGMNAFSFIPPTAGGDDRNVYLTVSAAFGDDQLRIDVSKTAQWEILFEHADRMGMFLHFKTQEQENDQRLDGGALGPARKLYYRELIARFSHHLALNWNIGEENTNTNAQRIKFANFFKAIDPYQHPIVLHTGTNSKELIYTPLLGLSSYNGVSMQCAKESVFDDTLTWVTESKQTSQKWVVANDEQGEASVGIVPDEDDPDHDVVRKEVLWGNIMAGGAGVEYYFGYSFPNSDLNCETFRTRDNMWDQSRHALDFFTIHRVPFWEMSNDNSLVTGDNWCLVNPSYSVVVVYLRNGGTTAVDLPAPVGTSYSVRWYDPRNGGALKLGSVTSVLAGENVAIGAAPHSSFRDWVVLLESSLILTVMPTTSMMPAISPTDQPISSPTVDPTDVPTDSLVEPMMATTIMDVNFNVPQGRNGFNFVSDMFVDGDEQYTTGWYSNQAGKPVLGNPTGGLVVRLGNVDWRLGRSMSGGFQKGFTTFHDMKITVQFDYQVDWARQYDKGEFSRIMMGIDNDNVYNVDYYDYSSPSGKGAWKTAMIDVGMIVAGNHQLKLGGINNRKNNKRERTLIYFDNVIVTGS